MVEKPSSRQRVSAVLLYETKPDVQAQIYWGELGTVEVNGKIKKLFCFSMILGYSRMRYLECTLSIDPSTLIQCHLNAFQYFGGYTQEILYDNMKQVVITRAIKSSDSEWTHSMRISSSIMDSFLSYADHIGLRQKGKLRTPLDT